MAVLYIIQHGTVKVFSLKKIIDDYFGGEGLDNDPEYPLELDFEPIRYIDECEEGYEIDVDTLPSGTKTIRFVNSY